MSEPRLVDLVYMARTENALLVLLERAVATHDRAAAEVAEKKLELVRRA